MAPKEEQQQKELQEQKSLPYGDGEEEEEEEDEERLVWYFAIGSMMHPSSCQHRDFHPLSSQPAKLVGYSLKFVGLHGVAEARAGEGTYMHGVLHHVTMKQMKHLDTMEVGYIRKWGKAIPYDSHSYDSNDGANEEKRVLATVYCRPSNPSNSFLKTDDGVDKPPTQRYLELLIAGANHWGVHSDYIEDSLKQHPMCPRKDPKDWLKLLDGDNDDSPSTVEYDKIPEDSTNDTYVSLNGKVLKYDYPPDHPFYKMIRGMKQRKGPHLEIVYSHILYDVKYGAPKNINEFTREHSAYLEDLLVGYLSPENRKFVQVVGIYKAQTWAD